MKKDLNRDRFKEDLVLIQLYEHAENYSASDEWLHFKLFSEKADGMQSIWEYTNMMLMDCGGKYNPGNFPKDNELFKNLSEFPRVNGTLPLSEE